VTSSARDSDRRILSVRQLNESIQAALWTAFPAPVWVRGEIQRLPLDAAKRQHVYFELHEPGRQGAASHQIPAAILGWDRDRYRLGRFLDGSDPSFRLQDKLEVCLLCQVDFYPPYGKVNLKVVGVDPEFSLGRLEARRRQVLAWLETEGLLRLNAIRPLADLPLRVGLVTSRGSAADLDVRTQLGASGYPFRVLIADCRMQGEQTGAQVAGALAALAREALDVIIIARGGGSRADLSWFDQQDLCAAVARCPLPVVAAIGHEIDTSLVDLCAHTRCKTPTAAAAFLVERVQAGDRSLQAAAQRLVAAAGARLVAAGRRLDACRRLAPLVSGRLREDRRRLQTMGATLQARTGRAAGVWQQHLQALSGDLTHGARRATAAAAGRPDYLARQLAREAQRTLTGAERRLRSAAGAVGPPLGRRLRDQTARLELLAARTRGLDPQRLLERGFTLTLDEQGALVRLAAAVRRGQVLRTRFRDGEIISTVGGREPVPARRTRRKGGSRDDEEDPGQQALF